MSDLRENSPEEKDSIKILSKTFLILCIISLLITFVSLATGYLKVVPPFAVAFFVFMALFASYHKTLSTMAFSFWMVAFIAAPMFYPTVFLEWGRIDLRQFVIPLIMSVMFCMGTTLSFDDFKRVFKMPHAVIVGVVLQFLVMPFVGKGVAMIFTSSNEVAAGIVITGSSPGGVASNVITFLANGNVALSVTMTAFSTLLAPIMTPVMTKWLAGSYIPVDFWKMLVTIIKMVIIPIGSGLLVHSFLEKMGKIHRFYAKIYDIIMLLLPKFSMLVIALACAIMTANARGKLLVGTVVISVVISVIVHNLFGLVLGYYGARAAGLGERECRTIAIEVGLQNSGMAAGLALEVLKSELASVPGVVYSSWHNITGAILASYWRRKPVK
ncbi:bile acid:sodium symporter family protein [Candidatus Latescibacterota bacterium]